MKITGVLWDSCPTGDDCEKTYGVEDGGVLVRYDKRIRPISRRRARRELGIVLPRHEGLLYVPAEQWNGGRS